MIPQFNAGFLPAGTYHADWNEFVERFSFGWRRPDLLEGLQQMLNLLGFANCTQVQLGGSFVSEKLAPGDFDGIYMLDGVDRSKLPLELDASVNAQSDIFGGMIVPEDWDFTDIGRMAMCLRKNKAGREVGVVVLNPQDVPVMAPWPRYLRHFPGATTAGPFPHFLPLAGWS